MMKTTVSAVQYHQPLSYNNFYIYIFILVKPFYKKKPFHLAFLVQEPYCTTSQINLLWR